jgi:hypothetical protein
MDASVQSNSGGGAAIERQGADRKSVAAATTQKEPPDRRGRFTRKAAMVSAKLSLETPGSATDSDFAYASPWFWIPQVEFPRDSRRRAASTSVSPTCSTSAPEAIR